MQETNEIRTACKILQVQILSEVNDEEEMQMPIRITSPSDNKEFAEFEDFERYLAELLVPNVELWDNNRELETLEEALDLIRSLSIEVFEKIGIGYPSLHDSNTSSSGKRWEWAVSKNLLGNAIMDELSDLGYAAFESCDDDNVLLTLETDCMSDFDDMRDYYQKVISSKKRVCAKCGHYIIVETFEIAEDDDSISIVCEDCYREQEDLGKDGVPAGLN